MGHNSFFEFYGSQLVFGKKLWVASFFQQKFMGRDFFFQKIWNNLRPTGRVINERSLNPTKRKTLKLFL